MQTMPNGLAWTDATTAKLRALWAQGTSARKIGRALGASANAVVGKAHRLHLAARASPTHSRGRHEEPRHVRAKHLPPGKRALPAPTNRGFTPVAVMEPVTPTVFPPYAHAHAGTCLWPIGEPGTASFHFCNRSAVSHRPYCETHCQKAYAQKRKTAEEIASNGSEGIPL